MDTNYWDRYYTGRSAPILPSQFAVFILGEYQPDTVLDIGCGSGRDSFWFAQQGIPTIGVDGSQAAVDMCNERANGTEHLKFVQADIAAPGLADRLLGETQGSTLIYARFFLHAINDDGQTAFLQQAVQILKTRGGILAVEYRTVRDQALAKATDDHYRRFIEPANLVAEAARMGLRCSYAVEGFGFAKYKSDDAYVARMIFEL
ncbi:class I SAM-dependent methyltransferase [Shinella daejeonensis]|uniref:class I SAM-dependent methyltransferase n=1 Tax=Shinella daejeonensis TaxID=659017 RepID=UPI0020C7E02A|nr:class I SAM-dependent methyltransferase [Shinella daejeonensis]MCP8895358.1 class I SAM-dependent methyltransferase [Shinella daejeonensis]